MNPSEAASNLVAQQVSQALAEDLGSGDLTAGLVPAAARARASVIAREPTVLCGRAWFDEVFAQVDPRVALSWQAADGDRLAAGAALCEICGNARSILSAERTALNFLQTLSGTASLAARYVAAVAGTGTVILDTRKTIPGLRHAQKYAVLCGGARNHRVGLYDAILIKENHIRAAGSIAAALSAAEAAVDGSVMVEVEVESLDEMTQALEAGARRILLDNFDNTQLREAVAANAGRAELEASGGVNLETVGEIAKTGVDYISVGQLTKDIDASDYSLLFESD